MNSAPRRAQQGVVLFIALIVLVAMSLAGIALIRGVDTGTLVAGNLAFRQAAMHVGDIGIEAARGWLQSQSSTLLHNDIPGSAYYASWAQNLVLVGTATGAQIQFPWNEPPGSGGPVPVGGAPAGYSVSYVIHRLCAGTGAPVTDTFCVQQTGGATATGGGTKGAAAFGQVAIQVPTSAMYRITARVVGPRNATSFVQAVVF